MSATPHGQEQRILLVRHGETEWSRTGRYTGTTDVPLTEHGRRSLAPLRQRLAGRHLELVLTSPLSRARETCEVIGVTDRATIRSELAEWDYGRFEGMTPDQIAEASPGWDLWADGAPGGESTADVTTRIDRVVAELRDEHRPTAGDVLIVAHGHSLRTLAARWIGLPIAAGRHLRLAPGTLSVLGWHREAPVICHWNSGAESAAS